MTSWHDHWLEDYVRRCGIVPAEPVEVDPSDDADHRTALLAKLDRAQKSHEELLSAAMTCKKANTPAWMKWFAGVLNKSLEAADSNSRVRWPGPWASEFHYET